MENLKNDDENLEMLEDMENIDDLQIDFETLENITGDGRRMIHCLNQRVKEKERLITLVTRKELNSHKQIVDITNLNERLKEEIKQLRVERNRYLKEIQKLKIENNKLQQNSTDAGLASKVETLTDENAELTKKVNLLLKYIEKSR